MDRQNEGNGDAALCINGIGYNLLTEDAKIVIGVDDDGNETVTVADSTTALTSTTIAVVNQSGTELSSTDGISTTIFYVDGTILVFGIAILLITKKRMSNVQ